MEVNVLPLNKPTELLCTWECISVRGCQVGFTRIPSVTTQWNSPKWTCICATSVNLADSQVKRMTTPHWSWLVTTLCLYKIFKNWQISMMNVWQRCLNLYYKQYFANAIEDVAISPWVIFQRKPRQATQGIEHRCSKLFPSIQTQKGHFGQHIF